MYKDVAALDLAYREFLGIISITTKKLPHHLSKKRFLMRFQLYKSPF